MYRYYFNPFRPLFLELEKDDQKVTLNSLQMSYDDLLSGEEVVDILDTLYTTGRCFGKFSLFNKWLLTEVKIKDKQLYSKINTRMNYCAMKVVNICPRCRNCERCGAIALPLEELIKFWDSSVFKTKAVMFRKEK